jgi:biotin operon repressor
MIRVKEIKMIRQVGSIDLLTGELIEGFPVWVGVKSSPYGNRWFMTNQDALQAIAKDKDLTTEPYRVLMILLGRLDFENWIHVSQTEIAEILNMKRQQVSRAIILLEKKGILLRSPKIGRSYGYRLNPYYGWKGKSNKLQNARLELVKG